MTTRKQTAIDDSANLVIDKVLEKRIAELIGTTPKALEHKRLSGFIPHGVWLKEGGRIICTAWSDTTHGQKINGSPRWRRDQGQ